MAGSLYFAHSSLKSHLFQCEHESIVVDHWPVSRVVLQLGHSCTKEHYIITTSFDCHQCSTPFVTFLHRVDSGDFCSLNWIWNKDVLVHQLIKILKCHMTCHVILIHRKNIV